MDKYSESRTRLVSTKSSTDKLYLEHSKWKTHVEILEPTGLIKSDIERKRPYGVLSQSDHGIREHPREEIYMAMVRDIILEIWT